MRGALPPDETKARDVRHMFDRIAPDYDRMNRLLTGRLDQRWRRELVQRIGLQPGERVLDLATGTGDLGEIAEQAGGHVVGLDFSEGMLAGARRRGITFPLVRGDAMCLPFADASYDAAVSGFALRNFASLPPVFAELARVVRPGGRIGLLEVDRPPNVAVRAGHGVYFGRIVPLLGGALADREAYRYLPQSVAYLPRQRELVRMLQEAGFHRIRKRRHLFGTAQGIVAERRWSVEGGREGENLVEP